MKTTSKIVIVVLLIARLVVPNVFQTTIKRLELEVYFVIILGILIFIYLERNHLSQYLINKSAYFFILAGCISQALTIPTTKTSIFLFYPILIGILVVMYKKQMVNLGETKDIRKGIVLGLFGAILLILFPLIVNSILGHSFTLGLKIRGNSLDVITRIALRAFFELFTVAVTEEIFFRGILVGAFLKWGLSEKKTWFTQAVLFWAAHYSAFSQLGYALIYLPVACLLFTLAAYKTKSLTPGIVAHGLYNSFAAIF
jgi:membrane protease YdiL (CAAX protease family)